jgi:hypothetical protein
MPQYEDPEIKKQIKNRLLLMKPFKETSRPVAFNSWEKAYTEGKPWARKVLAFGDL